MEKIDGNTIEEQYNHIDNNLFIPKTSQVDMLCQLKSQLSVQAV